MKKHHYLFFIIGLLLIGCSDKKKNFTEGKNSDSLITYLAIANEDTVDIDKRIEFNNKALEILLDEDNDSLNRENLFLVANRFYNMNRLEEYRKVTKIISKNSIAVNDNQNIAKAYSYLGDYYINTPKKDSAFFYYTNAEKIYKKLKDRINLGATYVNMAIVQNYVSDFSGSEQSAVLALDVLRETNEKVKIYEAYNILGVTSYGLKNYEKAIEYHTKALNSAKENNLTTYYEASSLNNLGGVYQEQNKYKLSISKFNDALSYKDILQENLQLYATLIDNLAYSKFKLNDFKQLPDLFYLSLKIRDSLNLKPAIAYTKNHLSEFYAAKNDTTTARKFAREALELSKAIKSSSDMLMSLKQMASVEPLNASAYSNEYIKIIDSLQQAERKSKNQFARISFETDEIIIAKDTAIKQKWIFFASAITIIIFGILLYIVRMQKIKQKELLFIQLQHKASEEIYQLILDQQAKFDQGREKEKKRIAEELHDGVMNKLTGIRLNLFVLEKKTDPETIKKCIAHISGIHSIEKEIRNIVHDLHQDLFVAKNDYPELLKTLAGSFESSSLIKIDIDDLVDWETIPAIIKMHIYRILQETIANSIKHSGATSVTCSIVDKKQFLELEINDNGKGFSIQNESAGIGLKNIKSRTAEMKGSCHINSSKKGTVITIQIPHEK